MYVTGRERCGVPLPSPALRHDHAVTLFACPAGYSCPAVDPEVVHHLWVNRDSLGGRGTVV